MEVEDDIQDLLNKDWAYFGNGVFSRWESVVLQCATTKKGLDFFELVSVRVKFAACVFYPLKIWLIVSGKGEKYWLVKKGMPDTLWEKLTTGLTKARKEKDSVWKGYVREDFIVLPGE